MKVIRKELLHKLGVISEIHLWQELLWISNSYHELLQLDLSGNILSRIDTPAPVMSAQLFICPVTGNPELLIQDVFNSIFIYDPGTGDLRLQYKGSSNELLLTAIPLNSHQILIQNLNPNAMLSLFDTIKQAVVWKVILGRTTIPISYISDNRRFVFTAMDYSGIACLDLEGNQVWMHSLEIGRAKSIFGAYEKYYSIHDFGISKFTTEGGMKIVCRDLQISTASPMNESTLVVDATTRGLFAVSEDEVRFLAKIKEKLLPKLIVKHELIWAISYSGTIMFLNSQGNVCSVLNLGSAVACSPAMNEDGLVCFATTDGTIHSVTIE